MTLSCSHCGEHFAATFSPEALAAYLAANDWCELTAPTAWLASNAGNKLRWRVFEKWVRGLRCEVEIPMMTDAPDYDRRVMEVLVDLRRVEQRPISMIARTIQIIDGDV